jgi:hypothetical protein
MLLASLSVNDDVICDISSTLGAINHVLLDLLLHALHRHAHAHVDRVAQIDTSTCTENVLASRSRRHGAKFRAPSDDEPLGAAR